MSHYALFASIERIRWLLLLEYLMTELRNYSTPGIKNCSVQVIVISVPRANKGKSSHSFLRVFYASMSFAVRITAHHTTCNMNCGVVCIVPEGQRCLIKDSLNLAGPVRSAQRTIRNTHCLPSPRSLAHVSLNSCQYLVRWLPFLYTAQQ